MVVVSATVSYSLDFGVWIRNHPSFYKNSRRHLQNCEQSPWSLFSPLWPKDGAPSLPPGVKDLWCRDNRIPRHSWLSVPRNCLVLSPSHPHSHLHYKANNQVLRVINYFQGISTKNKRKPQFNIKSHTNTLKFVLIFIKVSVSSFSLSIYVCE